MVPGMPDVFDQSAHSVETTRIHHKHRVANRVPKTVTYAVETGAETPVSAVPEPKRDITEYSETMRHEIPSANHLAAFVPKPIAMRFSTQAPTENIILLLRQHPVTQIGWIVAAGIGAFLPLLFDFVHFFEYFPLSYQIGVYLGWYLILLGFILESFIKWLYNVYIITDERIIDVDFHHLTYRNISAAKIDNIEDVTAKTAGFLSALFDFGTVTIQTAAAQREFEFNGVPHPVKVKKIINDLILEEEREKIEGRVN